MSIRASIVVALVVMSAVFAGVGAGALTTASPTTADQDTAVNNSTSFGAHLSGFMQSNAAQMNGSVDDGMFAANANASNETEKVAVVNGRIGALQKRMDRLEDRKQALIAANESGAISPLAYQAQMSHVVGEIEAINESINTVEPFARETGVNETALAELRANASNLTGPEVAAIAKTLGRGPPADVPRGPPADKGPDANTAGNNTSDPKGPPENPGNDKDKGNGNSSASGSGDADANTAIRAFGF